MSPHNSPLTLTLQSIIDSARSLTGNLHLNSLDTSHSAACDVQFSLPTIPAFEDAPTLSFSQDISIQLCEAYNAYKSRMKEVTEAECRRMIGACRQIGTHFGETSYDSNGVRFAAQALYTRTLQEMTAVVVRRYHSHLHCARQSLIAQSTIPRYLAPSGIPQKKNRRQYRNARRIDRRTTDFDFPLGPASSTKIEDSSQTFSFTDPKDVQQIQLPDPPSLQIQDNLLLPNDHTTEYVTVERPSHAYPARYSHSGVATQVLPSSSQSFFPSRQPATLPTGPILGTSLSPDDFVNVFCHLSITPRTTKIQRCKPAELVRAHFDQKSKSHNSSVSDHDTTSSGRKIRSLPKTKQKPARPMTIFTSTTSPFDSPSSQSAASRGSPNDQVNLAGHSAFPRTPAPPIDILRIFPPLTNASVTHTAAPRRRKVAPIPRRQPTAIVPPIRNTVSPSPLPSHRSRPQTSISSPSWSTHAISRTPSLASLSSCADSSSDEEPSTPPFSPTDGPDLLELKFSSDINDGCSISCDPCLNTRLAPSLDSSKPTPFL
ncbi:hypothetical protein DENSPDRAFT_833182 [Dentipellis sp. KUC8613]|nr:hypothetical protein DENSPDRAFT_833182 [Dentipellis sp. KUC8613]